MALFGNNKKTTTNSLRKIKPTVVKTDNVAKEIASLAKAYDIKPESLDFNLIDIQTYTRFIENGVEKDWIETDKYDLADLDEDTLLDENFQIKQIYEIEIFSRAKNRNPLDEFKIAIGANSTKCKVYMQIKPGSVIKYYDMLKEDLRVYIDKHKIRAGILVFIFDNMMDGVVSKLYANAKIEEIIKYKNPQTILIAEGIEPSITVDGKLIFHYKENFKEEKEKVDYSNRGFIQSVYKDELLIEYKKPQEGKPGRDCRGKYLKPKEPQDKNPINFNIDEESIYVVEDDESIKFFAKENGYIAYENNTYIIKSEADVNQVSFKTTGSITVGTDSEVNLTVKEKDAIKDAIGTGMVVEVSSIEIEGNVGDEAKVKALKANVGGLTHKTSVIEADEAVINVHKGTVKGRNIKVSRLEHGVIEGEKVYVTQALGGKIYAEDVTIDLCSSYVKVSASHKIEIKRLRGSENIFIIDPLQQRKTKESFEKNKEKIKELSEDIKNIKKEIDTYEVLAKKNMPAFNEIKKKLMHYKKNQIKFPQAFVKQYKKYQAQFDRLKELKIEKKAIEEKLNLLTNQADSLQYNIFDARVINHDKWIGYNEIRAKLIEPPIELVYKPRENEPNLIFGVVEVEEGVFEIRPVG